ncbi:Asp23/Gls24 family envelope stress response protein [Kineococcus aurantiacus]|uniref:Putative alkaline shock family protein YloU n=1 Tax=Kineococcus aurantiacus TaxID=37633 RepID=A0A7Y9DGN9_9ACTN|nr:putative alkaline shock family protein YloU [Kineococcus aurantiacus]
MADTSTAGATRTSPHRPAGTTGGGADREFSPAATPSDPQRDEMGSRGTLELKDRAVERIVQAAAGEVPGVAGPHDDTSRVGNALGRSNPRVDCQVAGRRVRAEVHLTTLWPQPAARVAAAVRDHVADRLRTLADLEVDSVEVHVTKVVRPTTAGRRRVQ